MTFKDMHHGGLPLLLPNAWDVPSALALLECGFAAIGTTSFGVASSLGRPDGGRSTGEANLGLAAALRPLDCYVSVDIEDGYADDPDQVADYVARLPVDGINIEDSTAERADRPATACGESASHQTTFTRGVRQRPRRHLLARPGRHGRGDAGPGRTVTSRQARTAYSFPVRPSPTC